jgi:CubicO group peptidase (beta-lactamase class C family)
MKFEDFIGTRIFKPLDMKDSSLGIPALDLSRLTTGYGVKEGKLVPSDKPVTSSYEGVGGGSSLTSSARDYLRFAQMLANGGQLDGVRLLAPGTVRLMSSNHLPDGVWMGMG